MTSIIQAGDVFKARELSLYELFIKSNRFYVPDYQRKYAWTKNQLDQFWEDLIKTHESCYDNNFNLKSPLNQNPHFLGGIVLTILDNENYEIIDGQQRLTTVIIFIKAMSELADNIKDSIKRETIKCIADPILKSSMPGMPFESKIVLDKSINDFFKEYILCCNNKEERDKYANKKKHDLCRKNSSKVLIKECYEYIYDKLMIDFQDGLDQDILYKKLYSYIIVIMRYMLILRIGVKNKDIAYTIFETLNKRGKDLSESDMIKNELFKLLDDEGIDVKQSWDSICENIENEDLTEYMRFSYISQIDNVTPAKLYEKIKEILDSPSSAERYIKNLEDESEMYGHIINKSNYWDIYTGYKDSILDSFKAIRSMDIINCTPLILSGAIRFIIEEDNISKFEKLMIGIRTFCFRYFTIGGNSVSNFEREIGLMSRAIRGKEKFLKKDDGTKIEINDIDDIIEYMKHKTPDSLFKKNFKEFSTKSMQLAFYIIYNLEKKLKTGVIPLPHGYKQHIEHIMPKKPSNAKGRLNEWKHVRHNPEYSEYINRLGNLMILESRINEEIKNKEFDVKLSGYKKSGLYYPEIIQKTYTTWDFTSIEDRQDIMSDDALSIWSYV